MGIYTSNRYFGEAYDYAAEIPANEAYDATFGCAHVLADIQRNDMALFESAIYEDIKEVTAIHEGYGYVNENAFTDIIKKIVEAFKKLLAKIKGIFKAFLAKINGAFQSGYDLVKKYEKQIIKYSNWKDFKVKGIRKPKDENIKTAIDGLFAMKISNKYEINMNANSETDIISTDIPGIETVKKIKDADSEDIKLALLNHTYFGKDLKISDYKDISEEILDHLYDDEDTLDDDDVKSASFFSKAWIKEVLSDKKWENDVKKINDKMDKVINKIIDDLNKTDNALASWMTKSDNKDKYLTRHDNNISFADDYTKSVGKDTSVSSKAKTDFGTGINKKYHYENNKTQGINPTTVQEGIHALQTLASNEQEVITKVTSEYMANVKFAMAQARKIWTAAAAWSSGVHKESVEYYQALADAEFEQVYTVMESL